MRGLLLKISLWFWLALALMFIVLALTILTVENGPFYAGIRALIRNAVTSYAQQAVIVYERDGAAATATFLNDLERTTGVQVELVDAQARSLTGRTTWPPDDEVNALVRQALQQESSVYRLAVQMTRIALPQRSERGVLYGFAGKLPARYTQSWRPGMRAFWWRFVVLLLTATLVCYGLARHLTKPIVQLQQATRRMAAGDWSARVEPQFTQRRDELAELAQDFNHMANRLAASHESQRRLLGDISHELRTPLTRLHIALALARQLIEQQEYEPAQIELDRIEREADRLNAMIGQLLALARAESGTESIAHEPIPLDELLDDIAADADFEARSRARSVTVTKSVAIIVHGPPMLLRSAIENVVRNAVRYTAAATSVEIELERAAAGVVIRVCDHGPGVPDEALGKLFLPFYRVGEARDRASGGTGLGLAITARTLHLLGGTATARNLTEGGLCVELWLP